MKVLSALAFLLVVTDTATADQLWASGSPKGIELLWSPPQDQPLPKHYTIRRALSGSGRWTEIATTAIGGGDSILAAVVARAMSNDAAARKRALDTLRTLLFGTPRTVAAALGTYFLDTTTTPGTEYDYQVWTGAVLVATIEGVVSHQRNIPDPPEHVSARQRAGCIELSWSTDSLVERGIVAVALYRAEANRSPTRLLQRPLPVTMLPADTVLGCFVRDCSVREGTAYTYYVAALDVFGSEGQPATISTVCRRSALSQPEIARVEQIGEELRIVARTADTVARALVPLIRTSDTKHWRETPFVQQDSILRLAPIVTRADAVAISVVARDGDLWSWSSIPVVVPIPDTTAPTRPVYCRFDRDGGNIALCWTPSDDPDVAGYVVESASATDTLRRFVAATFFSIPDTTSTHRSYRIVAADAHGNLSRPTPWMNASLPAGTRPELVAVTPTDHGTLVVWRNLPGTARVLVNRYDDTAATPLTIASLDGSATSYLDRARGSHRAWYQVVALDSNGRYSMPSRRVRSLQAERCTAPRLDSAVYRDGAVVLYWSHGAGSTYLVERIEAGSEDVVVLTRPSRNDTTFTDASITPGATYTYRLRCIGDTSAKEASLLTITVPQ